METSDVKYIHVLKDKRKKTHKFYEHTGVQNYHYYKLFISGYVFAFVCLGSLVTQIIIQLIFCLPHFSFFFC